MRRKMENMWAEQPNTGHLINMLCEHVTILAWAQRFTHMQRNTYTRYGHYIDTDMKKHHTCSLYTFHNHHLDLPQR